MIWLRSIVYFMLLVLSTVLLVGFGVLFARWMSQKQIDRLAQQWACLNLWLQKVICGLKYEVQGREHLQKSPLVVMPKHQSSWEILALLCWLPSPQSWVLKKELLDIPVFGRGLLLHRSIPVDRKAGRRSMLQVLKAGTRNLRDGRTVIIFPEGTRVKSGQKGRYNPGGALLATKTAADVVPVAHNSGVFSDGKGLKKYPGVIQVRIGAPISATGKTAEVVMAEVESWIETEMKTLPLRP